MDQDKIASTIKKIRKDNNLTQEQFAKNLGVTYQAVSKWENGKNIPDIQILKIICTKYNIDINDLLDNKIKINNKKINLIITILIIIIFILISTMIIHFHNMNRNNNDFTFKTIKTTCNDFTLYGSAAYNSNKTSIYISNIDYCGKDPDMEYKRIESAIYGVNGKTIKKLSEGKSIDNISLESYLKDLTFNVDYLDCDLLSEGLVLKISALTNDDLEKNYELPLELSDNCPVKLN